MKRSLPMDKLTEAACQRMFGNVFIEAQSAYLTNFLKCFLWNLPVLRWKWRIELQGLIYRMPTIVNLSKCNKVEQKSRCLIINITKKITQVRWIFIHPYSHGIS